MRLRIFLGLLVLALVLPAGAAAKSGGQTTKLAAKTCSQEKRLIGVSAFNKRYGRPPMPNCVKRIRRKAQRAIGAAKAECQAEVDGFGMDDFLEDWDSFEQCVAETAAFELEPEGDDSGEDDLEDDEYQ